MPSSGDNKKIVALGIVSAICYWYLFYFLERENFIQLLVLYSILFWCFVKAIKDYKHLFKTLLVISFLFKLIAVFATPNLSQDFYRFIWDGRVLLNGISPYHFAPSALINQSGISIYDSDFLIDKMGSLSAMHHSNYPPLNQLFFLIANLLSPKSVFGFTVTLKLLFLIFEGLTLLFGIKLLQHLKINRSNLLWYALNPLVIIECFGNLHFESIMLFFIIASLWYLYLKKYNYAALFLGLSVLIKVIPLLFLPIFWFNIPKNKRFKFTVIFSLILFIGFAPFFNSEFLIHYTETLALWFNKFEFNGSIYYLYRLIGIWINGYNPIAIYGKFIAISLFVFGITYAYLKRNNLPSTQLIKQMLILLSLYLFVSTTIHPWYLCSLVFLNVFIKYKYVNLWSYLIILSYAAYRVPEVKEDPLFLIVEYVPVFLVFTMEFTGLNLVKLHHLKKRYFLF